MRSGSGQLTHGKKPSKQPSGRKKMKDYKVPLSLEEYAEKAILGLSCFIIGVLALIGALSIAGV